MTAIRAKQPSRHRDGLKSGLKHLFNVLTTWADRNLCKGYQTKEAK